MAWRNIALDLSLVTSLQMKIDENRYSFHVGMDHDHFEAEHGSRRLFHDRVIVETFESFF